MYEAAMSPPKPRSWRALLGLACTMLACGVIALLTAWRLECVRLGPDPDTDAYGHYIIGRQLLETPENLSIHWVWLPAYHALLGVFAAAGLSLDAVRAFNALLGAAPPLMLLWGLRAGDGAERGRERAVSALAGVLAAAAPIAMRMGTTGQMEVFFSVLMLGAALLLARERLLLAAPVLALAVLTRYEAWAAVACVALLLALAALRKRALPRPAAIACVACPLLAVLAWAGGRWLQGEPLFGFLLDNQAFAEGALRRAQPDGPRLASALARYPLTMPALSFGAGALLALAGITRTARKESSWFVALPLAMLAFLVSGTLSRSHLGLERHFLPLVPFFAVWIAHGAARSAEWVTATHARYRASGVSAKRGTLGSLLATISGPALYGASFGLLALSALAAQQELLGPSWRSWRELTRQSLPSESAAGRFIANLPRSALVVCDEASVEVLSGLPAERFLRARVGPGLISELLRRAETREIFVVSKSDRIEAVSVLGPVVYRSEQGVPLSALHVQLRPPPQLIAR